MKLVVLCYPRTGSTLLIEALGQHPAVRQGMELFNPVLEGDAHWVRWRKRQIEEIYGDHVSYLDKIGYLDESRFDLVPLTRRFFAEFDATKIMYDQIAADSPVWDVVRALPGMRAIVLHRNIIDAAVSFQVAMDSNVWHVTDKDTAPPAVRKDYPVTFFGWFYDHFCSRAAHCVAKLADNAPIYVEYETMIQSWPATLEAVQRALGLQPLAITMPYRKRTEDDPRDIVTNFAAVQAHYRQHPVLAAHFTEIAQRPRPAVAGRRSA